MPIEDFPRDWDMDEENRPLYDQLTDKNQTISPFRGRTFADVFVYAMALGFHNKSRIPIRKKLSSIPYSALSGAEWIINSIAVAETGRLDILLNKPEVARIAQEYANGGMAYLKSLVFGGEPGDVLKKMEASLREIKSASGEALRQSQK